MNLTLITFLSRLKNASKIQQELVVVNFNKSYIPILKILYQEGFILNYSVKKDKITIRFRYYYNLGNLKNLKIISKISKMLYLTHFEISKIYKKDKLLVFSTSKGFLTSFECIKLKVGGIFFFTC
jgi:small subunit ribosomal protein S8